MHLIEKLLAELSLTKAQHQTGSQLSGGQQWWLSVCMALLSDPRFCVLDEPTTGVDRRTDLERTQSAPEGSRHLFTTHFMDEADLLAGAHLRPHVHVFVRTRTSIFDEVCLYRSIFVFSDRKAIMSRAKCDSPARRYSLRLALVSDTHFGIRRQLPVNHRSQNVISITQTLFEILNVFIFFFRVDLKSESIKEQMACIETLVAEKVLGVSCKRTPNQLLFTLPLSGKVRFPGAFSRLSLDSSLAFTGSVQVNNC